LRTLFLLLLLANLLYAAWAYWVAPPPVPAGVTSPAVTGAGAIRLLAEAPPVAAEPVDPATGAVELACVSAGPFVERGDAEQAADRLRQLGFVVRLRDATEELRVGLWVRLEGFATAEDATNAQAALVAAGVTEAVVLSDEGAGTVVSLGVYADPARTAEVARLARVAGFEPRMVDRLRATPTTWLDVDRQDNGGLPAIEQLQLPGGTRLVEIGLGACPEPSVPTGDTPAGTLDETPTGAPAAAASGPVAAP
jgi:hypothetical protein